ncbi:MAG TPA: cupin domain-containing protein [Hyphomicrobiaceae bacterium]|nr:cupin domain-containing protein [Hyphomicrobiaceae bacterium]
MRHTSFAALFLLLGGAAGIPVGFALSQAAPQMRVQVVLQHRVADIPLPANLEVRDDRWDPGAETGVHEHPGPVVLAVIEGELVEETPSGHNILSAGQAFWRPARKTHNVKNVSTKPARILAIHFDPAR